jgi:hypothetical protein
MPQDSVSRRAKSRNELDQFIPLVIREIHRLYDISDNGKIELVRTNKNKLDTLSREELIEILTSLWKKTHSFEFDKRNFLQRDLKNSEKEYYETDESDYKYTCPMQDEPIYLKILPKFVDWCTVHLQQNPKKYEIKYDPFSGEITLNGKFIHKTDFGSANDLILSYLMSNVCREITIDELKKATKLKRIRPFSKILDNMKLKGVKDVFFRTSSTMIHFRNRVSESQLKESEIAALEALEASTRL